MHFLDVPSLFRCQLLKFHMKTFLAKSLDDRFNTLNVDGLHILMIQTYVTT